jgi:hypothetical protein
MKNDEESFEKLTYERAVHVLKMFDGLPEDIKEIFTPKTEDELIEFEFNVVNFRIREREREKVIQLQKQYNLPFHPNQTLRDVTVRIYIQQFREKQK